MKHSLLNLLFTWRKTPIKIPPHFLPVHVADSYKRHSDRVRARIKTRAAEPQALQDRDRVAAGIGDDGGVGCFF